MKTVGIIAAHNHRESVLEPKRVPRLDSVSLLVKTLNCRENACTVLVHRLLQDRGERGACVLHITVDASGGQGLLANVTASQINAPVDLQPRSRLNMLC